MSSTLMTVGFQMMSTKEKTKMSDEKKNQSKAPEKVPVKKIEKVGNTRDWKGVGDSAPNPIRVQPTQQWPEPTKKKDK
jgi:hypothetical protein